MAVMAFFLWCSSSFLVKFISSMFLITSTTLMASFFSNAARSCSSARAWGSSKRKFLTSVSPSSMVLAISYSSSEESSEILPMSFRYAHIMLSVFSDGNRSTPSHSRCSSSGVSVFSLIVSTTSIFASERKSKISSISSGEKIFCGRKSLISSGVRKPFSDPMSISVLMWSKFLMLISIFSISTK